MKIYIIEDDIKICEELSKLLISYGYDCEYDDDFANILNLTLKSNADLILLDVNLPYCDGYHLCREIRKVSDVPIIIVTSRSDDMDELMSINLGADDFITKPYNTQILLARISAILRRIESVSVSDKLAHNGLVLYPSKSTANYNGKEFELTKNELKILSVLIHNSGKIISRDYLMNQLWQSDEFVDDNTLTVNINRLRKKLDDAGAVKYITTKRGQGYII